ncbi:MAG: hypothetical protein ACREV4_15900 [Gammaproteobacteria bacterium]
MVRFPEQACNERCIVIADQVQFLLLRRLPVDTTQEPQPLLVTVANNRCPAGQRFSTPDDNVNDLLDVDGIEEAALYAVTIGLPA